MDNNSNEEVKFIYEVKQCLMTDTEKLFFQALKECVPEGYIVQPQVNLATIITRTDKAPFVNELFRNIDFCILNNDYKPILLFEVNDKSHEDAKRKERDEKVKKICEEAGIQLFRLWTSYGINKEYIKSKINQGIENANDVKRISHHQIKEEVKTETSSSDGGACYIATAVYGSYEAYEVKILRMYRDEKLKKSKIGRIFIKTYYTISPHLVKWFGKNKIVIRAWKRILDNIINHLQS